MAVFEFAGTLTLSVASLAVAIWAVRLASKGNSLLMTLTKSIQAIETKNRKGKGQKGAVQETTKQKELRLREQKEQRKTLELELREKQREWKRKKDVAGLIKWFLNTLESDED